MMFTDSPRFSLSRIAEPWLVFQVHLDVFLLHPSRYLRAAKWRILDKKVRALGQFARLLSHSPNAYELWSWLMIVVRVGLKQLLVGAFSRPLPTTTSFDPWG
jgi:hypothetical protein